MNVGNAVVTLRAIQSILFNEEGQDRVLPFKVRYKLTRAADALEREFALYEKERVRLVQEFGDPVDGEEAEGAKVEVTNPEKLEKFYAELEKVLRTEIEPTPAYPKLQDKDLEQIENLEIELSDLHMRSLIEFIIEKDSANEQSEE